MSSIQFFSEDITFTPTQPEELKSWITAIIHQEGHVAGEINYVFCSDEYLLQVNTTYLKHDTYTDIITFDQSEKADEISGDIYVSIERVRENAQHFDVSEKDELHRVMIHGILHLIGYSDKSEEDKKAMRKKEEACLSLR